MLFLLLIYVSVSCSSKSDDPSPQEKDQESLLRMSVMPAEYNGDAYLVITDLDANILCTKKIVNGTDTSYYAKDGYVGETINVYVVNQAPPFYHTTAYLNIKRGSDWGPPASGGLAGVKNPIKIKLENVPPFSYLTYGTNYFSWTVSNINDTTGRTALNYIEAGKAYAQVIQNGEGRSGFFDIDESSHSATLNLSLLQPSVRKNVSAPIAEVWGGHFWLWGYETVGGYESNYLFMERDYAGNSFDVFYPSQSFSRYNSALYYYTQTRQYVEVRNGSLDLDYQPINFDAQISNPSPASFESHYTGQFDYFYAYYTSSDEKSFIHVYGAQQTKTFSIPDFSGVVPLPKLNLSDFKLKYISLHDLDDFGESSDYFKYYSTKPLFKSKRERIVTVLK